MFDYAKYLAAKELIDIKSVNINVWQVFVDAMAERPGHQLEILEMGGGIGTMLKRIASLPLKKDVAYTMLEIESENVAHFLANVNEWLTDAGYRKLPDEISGKQCWMNENGRSIRVSVIHQDIHDIISGQNHESEWDVLIAQAFLDLFDLEIFLPQILGLLRPDGLFYFPINFDGITSFLPTLDPDLDTLVSKFYHSSMDARAQHPELRGRSQSGRHLLSQLSQLPVKLLGAGGSDWLVYPSDGKYEAYEHYFLLQILEFVESELEKSNEISSKVALQWMQKRKAELAEGVLIYMTHQIDVIGAKKPI